MRKQIIAILFNLICIFSFGQGEYIVEINRANGHYDKIGYAIAGIQYVYPNVRTYSETTGAFIFQGGLSVPDYLYSINVTNGSIISNPQFSYNDGIGFQFDNSTGILYGLFWDGVQSLYFLQTINSATGAHSNVSTTSIPNMPICQGGTTFDEINHKYILATGNIIYSIDINTGAIIPSPTLGLLPGEVFICNSISFNNSTGILYGVLWDANITNKYFLVSVNPTSGVVTKIGQGTTTLEQNGNSAIDKVNQQYLYLYGSPSAGGWQIATIDITTGNIVYNALIAPFIGNDNFYSLEYDNILSKLYAIHWETISTKITELNISKNPINIFPNPFSIQTTIETYKPLKNATLNLYNLQGQLVKQIKNISGQTIIISRDNLSNGLYKLQLTQDNQTIATDKLVIMDN